MAIDYEGIAEELLGISQRVCMDLFPNGKIQGGHFKVGNLLGDSGDSLDVNLRSGIWKDFATNEAGGNLITLFAKRNNISNSDAAIRLVSEYALKSHDDAKKQPPKYMMEVSKMPPKGSSAPLVRNVGMWRYTDEGDNTLFYITRSEDKQFRPWTWNGNDWISRAWPCPRPLYNLHEVANSPDKKVLLVEGERCADAARRLVNGNAVVTTWPNGANSWKNADWKVLENRDVTIWPDADEPGWKAAKGIAEALSKLHCDVKIMDTRDVSIKGWDVADAIDNGWDYERIADYVRTKSKSLSELAGATGNSISITIENPGGEALVPSAIHADLWSKIGCQMSTSGNPMMNETNILLTLRAMGKSAPNVWYDSFADRLMTLDKDGKERWLADSDVRDLMCMLQYHAGFARLGMDTTYSALDKFGRANSKNSIEEWMRSEPWDCTDRIHNFFYRAFGVEQTAYSTATSANFLKSIAARATKIGCKVDTMVIFEGKQGIGKSMALRALCNDHFAEIAYNRFDPKEVAMSMSGHLVVEMGELHMFRRADVDQLKAFITNEIDVYRKPYGRLTERVPRRCVLVGTTNHDDYLADDTGNRRFWPVRCTEISIPYIVNNRQQLFAEALHRIDNGEEWHLVPPEEAEQESSKRMCRDEWEDVIFSKQATIPRVCTMIHIFKECFGLEDRDIERLDRGKQLRMGSVLKRLGWEKRRMFVDGKTAIRWVSPLGVPDEF